ncbi:MAG: hypothetical protein RLZZ292_2684 [Bacteroidota bacterium]|jgi:hypothetical protein
MRENTRIAYSFSLVVLGILTILSLVWYKERMFFVDPAWVTFNIINTKQFCFAEYRYGAFITQSVPLVCTYLSVPLNVLLPLYSVSFYAFFFGTAYLVGKRWNEQWLGILLAFYLTLFVSDVYFCPNNEVHQGIAWMLLFLALYRHQGKTNDTRLFKTIFRDILLVTFLFFALSSHLLVSVPFSFLWLFIHLAYWESQKERLFLDKRFLFYSLLLCCFVLARYKFSSEGWYDSAKLKGIHNFSFSSLANIFTSGHSSSFLPLLFNNYFIVFPILGIGTWFLFIQKKYSSIFFTFFYVFLYYVLICVTYPRAFPKERLFYIESEWMASSIILATPFVVAAIPKLNVKWLFAFLFVSFFIRLSYICNSFSCFHERFNRLEQTVHRLQQNDTPKAIFTESLQDANHRFIMSWGLPVESLLLSSANAIQPTVTFKLVDGSFDKSKLTNNTFQSCFDVLPIEQLHKTYFRLDTVRSYKLE